jgi:hypothetical protein
LGQRNRRGPAVFRRSRRSSLRLHDCERDGRSALSCGAPESVRACSRFPSALARRRSARREHEGRAPGRAHAASSFVGRGARRKADDIW